MQANEYAFLTLWKAKANAEEVYEILNDVEGYLRWWPEVYLAVKRIAPAGNDGLRDTYRLLTRGKLPYRLRWIARVVERRRPHGFSIEAAGDFVGRGIWSFHEHLDYLDIEFDWRLRAEKPLLKHLSFLLKPLFRWNHRWAMVRGEHGLRRELIRRRSAENRGAN